MTLAKLINSKLQRLAEEEDPNAARSRQLLADLIEFSKKSTQSGMHGFFERFGSIDDPHYALGSLHAFAKNSLSRYMYNTVHHAIKEHGRNLIDHERDAFVRGMARWGLTESKDDDNSEGNNNVVRPDFTKNPKAKPAPDKPADVSNFRARWAKLGSPKAYVRGSDPDMDAVLDQLFSSPKLRENPKIVRETPKIVRIHPNAFTMQVKLDNESEGLFNALRNHIQENPYPQALKDRANFLKTEHEEINSDDVYEYIPPHGHIARLHAALTQMAPRFGVDYHGSGVFQSISRHLANVTQYHPNPDVVKGILHAQQLGWTEGQDPSNYS